MNDLNSSLPMSDATDFGNVYKHFELRETLEKTKNSQQNVGNFSQDGLTPQINTEQIDDMIRTLPFMNDNIRINIKLSIEIYKQLNNFDHNYIHEVINEKSKNSK